MDAIYTYEFKGTEYKFKVGINAKIAIEKRERKKLNVSNIPPENLAKLTSSGLSEQEKMEIILSDASLVSSTFEKNDTEEYIELLHILLVSNRNYKDVTLELVQDMVYDMEEKLGSIETLEVLKEINDKTFQIVERMNNAINKAV